MAGPGQETLVRGDDGDGERFLGRLVIVEVSGLPTSNAPQSPNQEYGPRRSFMPSVLGRTATRGIPTGHIIPRRA